MESLLDETYLINLDSDTHRLENFDRFMTRSKWNYKRFSAVNGKALVRSDNNDETIKVQLELKKKYVAWLSWLSNSEIGCMLSHVSLWERVANQPDLNRVAIFEDDARTHLEIGTLHQLLSGFYNYIKDQKIDEPDILYLGKALDDCVSYEQVWGDVYRSKHPICLHAYIITKSGARKLLQQRPYRLPIDIVVLNAIKAQVLNVMVFHPSLYFQDVVGQSSNLRSQHLALNNTAECLMMHQHIDEDVWLFMLLLVIGLISVIILFLLYFR